MQYYFAPMEGLTDWIYRACHRRCFPGITQYYTPFLSPTSARRLTSRDIRELPQAQTLNYRQVPQILTKSPEDFLFMAEICRDLGYEEVNLNLGCPSGTVSAKGKGSGMLKSTDVLDSFLYEIYQKSPLPISIKTRIGFYDPEEFSQILRIYNRYPVKELIIHPRVREDFYKGPVHMDIFEMALSESRAPVCFNGNLCTKKELEGFMQKFPQVPALMLGRGLIGNPGLLSPVKTDAAVLQAFHGELLEQYTEAFGNARNAMFRMKENWKYMKCMFDGGEKLWKQLKKSTQLQQYLCVTEEIFSSLPLREELKPDW